MWSIAARKRKREKKKNDIVITFDLKSKGGKDYPTLDFKTIVSEQKKKTLGVAYDSDEDDERFMNADAVELYRRIERQYVRKGKKPDRKLNPLDFVNLGMGYDVEDDFIDDSEADKPFNPLTMVRKKKGFYVNEGPIEFEKLEDDEDIELSDEETQVMPALKPWESVRRNTRAPAIPGLARERVQRAPAIPIFQQKKDSSKEREKSK